MAPSQKHRAADQAARCFFVSRIWLCRAVRPEIAAEHGIEQLHTTADTKQTEIRDKPNEFVTEIEAAVQKAKDRVNRFFTFDNVKNVVFYANCRLNIVATVLLVYILFFKK